MKLEIARHLANVTVRTLRPSVKELLEGEFTDGAHFFVVMGMQTADGLRRLTHENFGYSEDWEYPYDQIALEKFRLSDRTNMDTRQVFTNYPHLLEEGDPKYWGSVVDRGLIVAGSGVQEWMDETICRLYAVTFHGLYEAMVRHHLKKGDGAYIEVFGV